MAKMPNSRGPHPNLSRINNPNIELLFLDTKAGENAGSAAMTGITSGVDIFIGPLFTEAVIEARAVMDDFDSEHSFPPMLLLSFVGARQK